MLRSYLPVIVFAGLGLLTGGLLAASTACSARERPSKAKSDPYECGLPSEVSRTFRFGVSFYMVAMLFILFDIEVVFLYPVGVILKAAHSVFVLVEVDRLRSLLLAGPRLRVAEGGARLEVKREKLRAHGAARAAAPADDLRVRQLRARDLLRGDLEGPDLDEHVEESRRSRRRSRRCWPGAAPNSIFPATFGLACCAIEMMSIVCPRYDIARFGAENMRASPRQADLLILSGRVSIKMAPVVRRIYDQMLEPKWAISMGACSSSGGMFSNYAVVQGADKFMPVDIHVPGCPPRPEALIYGFNKLQRMIQGNPDPGGASATTPRAPRSGRATTAIEAPSPRPSRPTRPRARRSASREATADA